MSPNRAAAPDVGCGDDLLAEYDEVSGWLSSTRHLLRTAQQALGSAAVIAILDRSDVFPTACLHEFPLLKFVDVHGVAGETVPQGVPGQVVDGLGGIAVGPFGCWPARGFHRGVQVISAECAVATSGHRPWQGAEVHPGSCPRRVQQLPRQLEPSALRGAGNL